MIEFSDAIRASGLEPPLSIEPGFVIRFPGIGKGPKNKAAWCRLFDDCMGGVFGDYSSGLYEVWQSRRTQSYTPDQRAEFMRQVEASRKQHAQERAKDAHSAAQKAKAIIKQARIEQHAYLDSKGFREAVGLVWYPDDDTNLLVIPMEIAGEIVGCQLIDRNGVKKFLKGQRTNGAAFTFGSTGIDVWCEGYATARSIHACLAAMKVPAKVHACFSAGNMQRMAKTGFVIGDNDASQTGEKAAQATGLPYWMPEQVGTDFNNLHAEIGTFAAGMKLRQWLQKARNGVRPEPGARVVTA